MAKIHITTQYAENYGAHDWDGTGECPQYWKFKGGEDYFLPIPAGYSLANVAQLVELALPQLEWSTNHSQSTVINWVVVADDFATESERLQLEYEGRVMAPTRMLAV